MSREVEGSKCGIVMSKVPKLVIGANYIIRYKVDGLEGTFKGVYKLEDVNRYGIYIFTRKDRKALTWHWSQIPELLNTGDIRKA